MFKNGKGTSTFTPKVLQAEKNIVLEWLDSLPIQGLFNGQHKFYIEKISDNRIRFIHSEQFTGLLAGLLMKMIGDETRKGFIAMNEALKRRAEQ